MRERPGRHTAPHDAGIQRAGEGRRQWCQDKSDGGTGPAKAGEQKAGGEKRLAGRGADGSVPLVGLHQDDLLAANGPPHLRVSNCAAEAALQTGTGGML